MKQTLIHAAIAAGLLGVVPAAYAVPTLTISADDGTMVTCADGAACDANGAAGAVTLIQSFGAFSVNVTTGLSYPALKGGNPLIDLNTVDIQVSDGAHRLTLKFSDTGFNLYGGRLKMVYGGTLLGAGASFEHSAYYDESNALWGEGVLIGQVALGASLGGFGGSIDGGLSPTGPYSVTETLTLWTAGKTTFSGDFAVNVPEPTTLALLGLGLLGFAGARRLRERS
jgi:hypothetical protein